MGGTITLDPDGTYPSLTFGWSVVGGGSLHSAVNDASDATYVTDTTPGAANTRISWTLSTSALPAGSAVKYSYPVIRNSQPTGNRQLTMSMGTYYPPDGVSYQSPAKVWTPVAGIADTSGAAAGAVPQSRSQGVVDLLFISLLQYPSSAFAEDHRIYKVQGKVVYVDSPIASGLALNPASGNTLTTRPGVQWTYSSPDSMPQYEYRVALWKQTDINLFPGGQAAFEASYTNIFERRDNIIPSRELNFTGSDAQVHTCVWNTKDDTGLASWIAGTANSVTPDVDLDGTSAYVYYVQVSALHAGERLFMPSGATSFAKLSFTQAITIPTVATSVTPTWQRDFQFRTQVQVVLPAQALGAWTGRRVQVERRILGSATDDWRLIPLAVKEQGAGAGTLTFYDTLPAVNRVLQYRAKVILWNALGYTSSSAYVVSGSSVTCDFTSFVLRDPLNDSSSVVLRINGDLEADRPSVQGQFQPLAADLPVVVSDGVKGRVWHVEARVKDQITETFIDQLRFAQTPLVLHTDMTDAWYWVRFGANFSETTTRQVNRKDPTKREQVWRFDLIEVGSLPGQPQVYF